MKVKYLASIAALIILVFSAVSVFAQEGEMQVVDEVIAQVNDDVITLSMLKKETKERVDALKQSGMTEQQATEEVNKRQGELIATLINEKLLLQRGKELDLASERLGFRRDGIKNPHLGQRPDFLESRDLITGLYA